ncbi:hypothetical protein BEN47_07880 [Hymenobacter lapidarius]|uniref:site-specific DNA-methyltransferase (adenine-specific) n=1 Tax=Hymenobacter lapidarius TaxID=1908237 RepID=A0A1G1TDX6_9BACT|nr:Eco57I restriction-modification methylase domain-containing protein [Hymenobacter lapidarius]OGX89041.1 hypothetical protein BEN47_07880 [Hymenobacter lapidarius]
MLGLVFEKINGYKDGSFYTPGFVTMYMARQTLGRAVVRHFAQAPAWPELAGCDSLEELQDRLAPARRPQRLAYAAHFNTLTVLDPAVGSGHFLVSALNELLHLKSRLGLFLDEEGGVLPYTLEVEHDELIVTDADGLPAPYRVATFEVATGARTVGPARTRLQQALFREKRALMEHTLFGVDLNPNSVRICRLRLWIELLKHAYYRPETGFRELETLPNLDLNVKTGNSLLARFGLDADLSEVWQKGAFSLPEYRAAVRAYFGSRGRDEKNRLLGFFGQLKEQLTAVLHRKDKKREKLRLYRGQFAALDTQHFLIPETARQREAREWEMKRLQQYADQLDQEIAAHEQGALFREAFEWRFEFPEVLDEAGRFRGFDVVMGNPPYIRQEAFTALKPHLKQRFGHVFAGTADLYVYFLQLGAELLAPGGELSYIVPNKWLRAGYGAALRGWLASTQTLLEFVDFGDLPVFPEATTYPAIVALRQGAPAAESTFRAAALLKLPPIGVGFNGVVSGLARLVNQQGLNSKGWNLAEAEAQEALDKMRAGCLPLTEYVDGKMYNGVKTGFNEAFVIDEATRQELINADPNSVQFIRPFLAGRDVRRYQQPDSKTYLLYIDWGFNLPKFPAIEAHLLKYKKQLEARGEAKAGRYPWYALERPRPETQQEFEKLKISWPGVSKEPSPFAFDTRGFMGNDNVQIIVTDDKFLLGVLNSSSAAFFIDSVCDKVMNGYLRMKMSYIGQLPIPAATTAEQAAIAALVQQILDAKAADPAADTAAPEAAVDAAVAALYGVALPAAVAP